MNEKKTGLENFVERHRADFDAFEPRPDLWDDIEQQLAAPVAGPAMPDDEQEMQTTPLRVVRLHPAAEAPAAPVTAPASTERFKWLPRPGIAAALALLLTAGAGAIWSSEHRTAGGWVASKSAPLTQAPPAAESPMFTFEAAPVAAGTAGSPAQRLSQEVRRMESYFAVQIEERQAELQKLEASTATALPATDWQRELAGLDSTYQQLKQELYRNPEPAVVLEAMNRNLQIRLDILNQQTRTREQMQEYHSQPVPAAEGQPRP